MMQHQFNRILFLLAGEEYSQCVLYVRPCLDIEVVQRNSANSLDHTIHSIISNPKNIYYFCKIF